MFLNDRVETKSNAIHHFWRNSLDRREGLTAKDLAASIPRSAQPHEGSVLHE